MADFPALGSHYCQRRNPHVFRPPCQLSITAQFGSLQPRESKASIDGESLVVGRLHLLIVQGADVEQAEVR
jgi:hypothetical protein